MDSYEVKIYPAAKQDLRDVIAYLNTLSADTALRYYDELTEKIAGLSEFPLRCAPIRDPALAARGYRCLFVRNYIVFFVVEGKTVQVRRILYARRDYASIL
ncbi:MAG: type II toxin-antitoxin system RelE/ParE family toxin [Oscillospiraceae bacterium]|nr:type II toxin-antitoxin system RelE/ParE family toxin [Oscillospiraceae bacterium]